MKSFAKRLITPIGVALVFIVTVSGCAVPGAGDAPQLDAVGSTAFDGDYNTQGVVWAECDEEILSDAPSSILATSAIEVVCGEVIVPANYDDLQLGVDFRIQMMKLTAKPDATERDAIFINPGGPGGSGVEQVQSSNFPRELLDSYDIIGFDPRGVGTSIFTDGTVIKCSDELDYLSYFEDSSPTSLGEYEERVVSSNEYYRDCVERNPLWWTLSTDAVARDLDTMRQAVTGDRPLNFIGSSYGTTIAGRYVTNFPDRVGKIVLDSPTTVNEDRIASALQSVAADEAKLEGFLDGYAAEYGITSGDAFDRLLQIRDWARAGELVGFAGPVASDTRPGAQVSSEALFRRGLLTMNYLPERFAQDEFTGAVDEALDQQSITKFEWYGLVIDGYEPDSLAGATLGDKALIRSNEFDVRVIVNSMDFSFPELSEEQQVDLSIRAKQVAPLLSELSAADNGYEYVGPRLGVSFSTIARDDPDIPSPPDTPFIPQNPSGIPLLVVGATDESVTPFTFAVDTAELLDSVLITVESSEHAPVAGYRSNCLNDVIVSFFTSNTPPAPATCSAEDR